MNVTLRENKTVLDIMDTEALNAYIREHIQVITAHTEECFGSSGVCISIVAPPHIQFFDAMYTRVDILIGIENTGTPAES